MVEQLQVYLDRIGDDATAFWVLVTLKNSYIKADYTTTQNLNEAQKFHGDRNQAILRVREFLGNTVDFVYDGFVLGKEFA